MSFNVKVEMDMTLEFENEVRNGDINLGVIRDPLRYVAS